MAKKKFSLDYILIRAKFRLLKNFRISLILAMCRQIAATFSSLININSTLL